MISNNTLFHVGIVKNTEYEFKVKVGLTRELCNISKTLSFEKKAPYANKCNYKSLGMFQSIIINVLRENNFQNLGIAEDPDDEIYYMQHRFSLTVARLPVTRL